VLEYFYFFEWGPCTDNKCTKGPLDLTMQICCGSNGATFGPDYINEDVVDGYSPNDVWESKYGNTRSRMGRGSKGNGGNGKDRSVDLDDPSTYGWVQFGWWMMGAFGFWA